jgi:hypothetical protein
MSEPIKGGDPAFPTQNGCRNDPGMSLRDYFAGQALAGLSVANVGDDDPPTWDWESITQTAYKAADAMLEARKEVKP